MKQEFQLKQIVEEIFEAIPKMYLLHDRKNEVYILLNKIVKDYFSNYKKEILEINPFKGMQWPRISLGNLTSYDFFSMDEMVLYSFYWINRDKYKVVFDIGANVGIDSIILSLFGYEVYSFEPDPSLYEVFQKNINLNRCDKIHPFKKAISDSSKIADFVRVEGNTTASHILGARDFYGDAEYFKVETMTFLDVGIQPDLIKINVEGHEKYLVPSIAYPIWKNMDAFIEVHNKESSELIFKHFCESDLNIFAQKLGWQKVKVIEEMPVENKEGYVFVSSKQEMPWQENSAEINL